MTPQEEIQAFLDSKEKDFNVGYTLFVNYSNNRALALYLARKKDMSKLVYELGKMVTYNLIPSKYKKTAPILRVLVPAEIQKENIVVLNPVSGERLKIVIDGKINYNDLPEDMKIVYDKNVENYRLQRTAHEQMKLAESDEDRAKFRLQVITFEAEIENGWKMIDDWAAGIEKPKPTESNPSLELVNQINASRAYLSRNVSSLDKKQGEEKEKMIAELKKRVDTLVQVKAPVKKETFDELMKQGIIDEKTNLQVK
jgi:hypothetical protein